MLTGIATPCMSEDPAALVELAVHAESAGFDGFFVWDHLVYADDGMGPDLLDPWTVLAAVAANTTRIRLGPLITPPSRRRPWMLARQCASLDRLSNGRLIFGAGLGSPADGDFGRFGEATDLRTRAEMLDESLDILTGLWTGEPFSYSGDHYQMRPVRFRPSPVQRPRIPIWLGGVLPARRPLRRAARWDGVVPIRFRDSEVVRPSPKDISEVRAYAARHGADLDTFDVVVWSQIADPNNPPVDAYRDAGATWWIETGQPGPNLRHELADRIAQGPV